MGRIQKIQSLNPLMATLRIFLRLLCIGLLLNGCATYQKHDVETETVALDRAVSDLPESQLLDVRIQTFDPGELPESKEEARGLSPNIRQAEALYIPAHLKATLQQTGYWGAVRVVPAGTVGAEVSVTGRIVQSDGEVLEVEVDVYDATGAHWFKRSYGSMVDSALYAESANQQREAFQNLYTRIANDCAAYRRTLTPEQIKTIRQVAELRFAAEFAPDAFNGYLQQAEQDEGNGLSRFMAALAQTTNSSEQQKENQAPQRYSLNRLPAQDDPMLARVQRVRERDYLLVDTLDGQYERLYRDIGGVYTQWRQSRMTETDMIRKIKSEANKQRAKAAMLVIGTIIVAAAVDNKHYTPATGVLAGGLVAVGINEFLRAGDKEQEAEMNKAALEELGASFSADVEPVVVEVEGKTVELTGSADAIYQQWRGVLERLHEKEAGQLAPVQPIDDAI